MRKFQPEIQCVNGGLWEHQSRNKREDCKDEANNKQKLTVPEGQQCLPSEQQTAFEYWQHAGPVEDLQHVLPGGQPQSWAYKYKESEDQMKSQSG